jgi:hypothetical protein
MKPLSNPSIGTVHLFQRGDEVLAEIAARRAAKVYAKAAAARERRANLSIAMSALVFVLTVCAMLYPWLHREYLADKALKADTQKLIALEREFDHRVKLTVIDDGDTKLDFK